LVLAAVSKHLANKETFQTSATIEKEPPVHATWDINKNGSPYPGLLHFTRKYAPVFFGRETEINDILNRTRFSEGRFLIVSGASSLVDCGVLSRIEQQGISGNQKYKCIRMVPSHGNHPFDALVRPLHVYVEQAGMNAYELAEQYHRCAGHHCQAGAMCWVTYR
jgi:hypothetical protein